MLLMKDKRLALANWMRTERVNRGWSQSDLADRMGKVRAVVNKIERAGNDPTLETLSALAGAFGYPLTIVLNVIGYDVELENKDLWVTEQTHKLNMIPANMRGVAGRFIESVIASEEPKPKTRKAPSTK